MLQRIEAEVGEIGRFGVPEDAEDAALVAEFVHVSSLLLPTPDAVRHAAAGPTRRHPRLDRGAPGRLGLGDGRARAPRARRWRCGSAAPPVRPMTRAGSPPPTARAMTASACAAAVDTTIERRRLAEQRLLVGHRADAPAHGSPIAAGTSTSTPMPPVSKQHSASATARPPSDTSCADSMSRSATSAGKQLLHGALARRDRRAAARRAPGRARS